MNEIQLHFSDGEMVAILRQFGGIVSQRNVEKWSGNECYHADVWQIKRGNGEWVDALPVFRELMIGGIGRSIAGSINQLDLLNIIK